MRRRVNSFECIINGMSFIFLKLFKLFYSASGFNLKMNKIRGFFKKKTVDLLIMFDIDS